VKAMGRRQRLDQVGEDPDYRFSLANERTFLAWIRTALALLVAGLAVVHLLPAFAIRYAQEVIGVTLIVMAAATAFTSYIHWERSERAMRLGRTLPRSVVPVTVAVGLTVIAVAAIVFVLAEI